MNLINVFIAFTFVLAPFIFSNQNNTDTNFLPDKKIYNLYAFCPDDHQINRSVMEDFLTSNDWSSARNETNTGNLTIAQITALTSSSNQSVCNSFNNQYQQAINEEWNSGGQTYNVSYYKVGNYYFVIIGLKQPQSPNIAAVGSTYLVVYDQNLDLIKGYAF